MSGLFYLGQLHRRLSRTLTHSHVLAESLVTFTDLDRALEHDFSREMRVRARVGA